MTYKEKVESLEQRLEDIKRFHKLLDEFERMTTLTIDRLIEDEAKKK